MPVYFIAKGFGLLILLFVFLSNAEKADNFALRIRCGSKDDFGYSGGVPFEGAPVSISPFPVTTGRTFAKSSGPVNCYRFSVPSGTYSIRVFFGIPLGNSPTRFVISIKGTIVLSLPIDWSDWDEETFVEVLHSVVYDEDEYICFHSFDGSPTILSVELFQLPNTNYLGGEKSTLRSSYLRTHTRLNFGTSESSFEQNPLYGNRFWKGVSRLADNDKIIRTDESIVVTSHYPSFIYNTALIATPCVPDLRFMIKRIVPHRIYTVIFHFCQINGSIGGSTVFDIKLDEIVAFRNFDLLERAYTSVTVNYTIYVPRTSLMIYLKAQKGSISFINAIELHEVIEPAYNTFSLEVSTLVKMKSLLQMSPQLGWNGDPCSPERYRWTGIQCSFDQKQRFWFIRTVSLAHQSLKGFLPDDLAILTHLTFLNLSFNEIDGSIAALGSIKTLEKLDLSNNRFNGSIPSSFVRLPQLTLLNLSTNLLSGEVPKFLPNVSVSLGGNIGLCGNGSFPSCHYNSSVLVVLVVGFVFLVLMASIAVLVSKIWRSKAGNLDPKKAEKKKL